MSDTDDGEVYATPPSSPYPLTKTPRGTFIVLSDSDDDENNNVNNNNNCKSTAKKKEAPRSLARLGSKKEVRQVFYLKPRLGQLQGCVLTPKASFFICEWADEFEDNLSQLSRENEPRENVNIMLQRVKLVYNLFKETFSSVSGVYIGKSTNVRSRWNSHMKTKQKPNEALALIGVGLFTQADVSEQDEARWGMTCEVLGFQYERLLTKAVVDDGLPTFDDRNEPGGGGRCGGEGVQECIVYMLIAFSNDL